jgi:c-di-GMP-binding flagellar brake protein YcgR
MTRNRQLKISVERDLAEAFKASCAKDNASMASEIARFMQERIGVPIQKKRMPDIFLSRRQRRDAVRVIVAHLRAIAAAEDAYRANIPENLKGGPAHDAAETAVDIIEEAVTLLEEAFA